MSNTTAIKGIGDGSKKYRWGADFDYRTGNINAGALLGFAPYEKGYNFIAVMQTPKFMQDTKASDDSYGDDRMNLLESFIDILELEFTGLSGIEDQTMSTNDISNNILNMSIPVKTERNINSTIDMTFTEKSGTPITKFLDMYTRYMFDPYTGAKTYGGRLRTGGFDADGSLRSLDLSRALDNETFTLLYVVTDSTCMTVEKAFILYRAMPLNVPFSTLYNGNKFEVEKAEVSINWVCTIIDGPIANKIGTIYCRNIMMDAYQKGILDNQYDVTKGIRSSNKKFHSAGLEVANEVAKELAKKRKSSNNDNSSTSVKTTVGGGIMSDAIDKIMAGSEDIDFNEYITNITSKSDAIITELAQSTAVPSYEEIDYIYDDNGEIDYSATSNAMAAQSGYKGKMAGEQYERQLATEYAKAEKQKMVNSLLSNRTGKNRSEDMIAAQNLGMSLEEYYWSVVGGENELKNK